MGGSLSANTPRDGLVAGVVATTVCGWPFLALLPAIAEIRFNLAEDLACFECHWTGGTWARGMAMYGTMEQKSSRAAALAW